MNREYGYPPKKSIKKWVLDIICVHNLGMSVSVTVNKLIQYLFINAQKFHQ